MSFHYLLASIELSVQPISSFLVGLIAVLGLQSFIFPNFCHLFRLSSCFFCVHLNTLLFSNLIYSYLFWTFLFLLIPETKFSYSQQEYAVLSFFFPPLSLLAHCQAPILYQQLLSELILCATNWYGCWEKNSVKQNPGPHGACVLMATYSSALRESLHLQPQSLKCLNDRI